MFRSIDDAPADIALAIREFWDSDKWDEAASIAYFESGWDPFATADTRDPDHPCGSILRVVDGVDIAAEFSIGVFQINACNLPAGWDPAHLYNVRHNCGTAHLLYVERGWEPWYFSAKLIGLL